MNRALFACLLSLAVFQTASAQSAAPAPPPATAPALVISGTGATFPAQVYAQWAERYAQDTGVKINYTATGSSAGVKGVQSGAADFGATDIPLSAADLEKFHLFQFPTLVGGVVPVVQLPGLASGRLRLNADVLVGIFTQQITRWNDAAIVALNPGLSLPALRITPVVRADGSGTTEVFLTYLKQVASKATGSADIKGAKTTTHPNGSANAASIGVMAMEGSSKLVAAVKATPGAIGYVSSDYVLRDSLTAVSLPNKHGEWVMPNLDSYRAALRAGELFKNSMTAAPLINVDGSGVWPIVTATYIVVDRAPQSLERAGRTLNFFYRSFLLGDKAVAGTGFAALPITTQARIVAMLTTFRTIDGQLPRVLGHERGLPENPVMALLR
jgi:phosphate transport system substrate-binding protein